MLWTYFFCLFGLGVYRYDYLWLKVGIDGMILIWRKMSSIEADRGLTLALNQAAKLRVLWCLQNKDMEIPASIGQYGTVWYLLVLSIRRWPFGSFSQMQFRFERETQGKLSGHRTVYRLSFCWLSDLR